MARTVAAATPADEKLPNKEKLTRSLLDGLLRRRPHRQSTIWDTQETGLSVLVSRGPKDKRQATVSFRVVYYLKTRPGKPHYIKLGRYPDDEYTYKDEHGRNVVAKCSEIDDIRDAARIIRVRAKQGTDPKRPTASEVFEDVVKDFIELYAKKNRSWKETARIFKTYVLPDWRYRRIADIKRSDVAHLLDRIEKRKLKLKGQTIGGRVTADATLAQLSKLFNWHATRTDDFVSPIVKGMRRAPPPKDRARQRVLSDQELQVMWPILGEMGTYGAAVKCMLLTAQRARKVAHMRRSELKDGVRDKAGRKIDTVWDAVRDDDPENKGVSVVPLPRLAREIIDAVPIIDSDSAMRQDFVFSVNGRQPLNGWSKYKDRLDRKMAAALHQQGIELRPWQLRDLRRTARTLMSRAGISTEIAERALGHEMTLVRGTYDRHDYLAEKRDAFEKLANLIERIINPAPDNVVAMAPGRHKKGTRR